MRKGQLAGTSTLVLIGLLAVALLAGGYFLGQLNTVISTLVNNLFYLSIAGGALVISLVFALMAYQGKLSDTQAAVGGFIVLGTAFILPIAGVQVGHLESSYGATVTVSTSQQNLIGTVSYDNLKVSNVKRYGPKIFGTRSACIVNCHSWTVQLNVKCNGKHITSTQITGTTGATVSKVVKGLPANSQCSVTGTMVTPSNHGGHQGSITRTFSTSG